MTETFKFDQNEVQKSGVSAGAAIGFSLLFHSLIWLSVYFTPTLDPRESASIEIEMISEEIPMPIQKKPEPQVAQAKAPPRLEEQVVDQDDKSLNEEVDEKSRFLGKHNQKVLRQTIAKDSGAFQNVKENRPPPAPKVAAKDTFRKFQPSFSITDAVLERLERERLALETDVAEPNPVQLKSGDEKSRLPAQDEEAVEEGQRSQSVDYIKEIDPGLETALSTKEFVFHGFYTRIRRQLEQHWNPKVRTQFVEWRRKGRRIASSENMVTRCLITLDKTGNIVSVKIIGDSGLRELDQIAVDALRSAAPFPNPPGGMVDEDGSIKIRWDFILET